jgi:hypothetical protein
MSVVATGLRRLPGIRFEAPPPPEPGLPRMDVAGFVGFAATGPLDVPVAVADMAQFADVFGAAAPLFWDPVAGEPVGGYLAPAVRAFFRNGGTRCWVVRVAGRQPAPWRAGFPVPGLAFLGNNDGTALPEQAMIAARAAGSWADEVTVTAGLLSSRLALTTPPRWDAATSTVEFAAHGTAAGDLIRVTYPGTGTQLMFTATGTDALWLSPWSPAAATPATAVLPDGTAVRATIDPDEDGTSARVALDSEVVPPAGALVRLDVADGPLLLPVRRVHEGDLIGRPVRPSRTPPDPAPTAPAWAEVLTVELTARVGHDRLCTLGPLAFHPDHPRYAGALPSDEELYATVPGPDDPAGPPWPPLWPEVAYPRFPLAGIDGRPMLYPIGMETSEAMPPAGTRVPALERDGLRAYAPGMFLDPALTDAGTATLLETADFVRYRSARPRALVGIHALLRIDEVTIVAVPDAVHQAWEPAAPEPIPDPPPHQPFAAPAECDRPGPFRDCAVRSLPAPRWESARPGRLTWAAVDGATAYVVTEPGGEIFRGPDTTVDLYGLPHGTHFYRVRALAGDTSSDWSDWTTVTVTGGDTWTAGPPTDATLLAVHRALLRMCAARGDMLAVLSVPRRYRERDVVAHTALLRGLSGDERTPSFGAVYHPWPVTVADPAASAVAIPPDGIAGGVLARRAASRGAWIAPANEILTDVVALEPEFAPGSYQLLQDGRVNTVRNDVRGFRWLSADTLSDDPDLRPVNVRRLLSLLRRVVVRDGPTYVFEPDDDALARHVERGLEAVLGELLARGAVEAYQVVIGGSPDDSLLAEVKVAPARPLRFLTVQLVRTGDRVVVTEGA